MNTQTQEALKMAIEYIDCNCHEKNTKAMVELLTKALEQPAQERNFCSRCGKRASKDLNSIHTCTPPNN